MLGKLIKYEFKATTRIFLPLFTAVLAMAIITRLTFSLQWEAPRILSMVLSILLIVAAFVITLILTIQRFYKNFLTNEGYLTLTLPVSTGRLIAGKLIVAMVWTFACTATAYIAILIMTDLGIEWHKFVRAIHDIGLLPADLTFFIIEFIALTLASLATGILMICASMSLSMFSNKHRVALSFAFFIGLNTLQQIVMTVVFRLFIIPGTKMTYPYNSMMVTSTQEFFTPDVIATTHNWSIAALVLIVGFGIGMYYLTRYMLKNNLNLQ